MMATSTRDGVVCAGVAQLLSDEPQQYVPMQASVPGMGASKSNAIVPVVWHATWLSLRGMFPK
jgi:hypothetical protein